MIPGGFGIRGMEGKINAIKYSRKNKIPLFGICLGMQLIAIGSTQCAMDKGCKFCRICK